MTGDVPLTPSQRLRMQGALIAVADAPPIDNLSSCFNHHCRANNFRAQPLARRRGPRRAARQH